MIHYYLISHVGIVDAVTLDLLVDECLGIRRGKAGTIVG